jgi:hypothetical protein
MTPQSWLVHGMVALGVPHWLGLHHPKQGKNPGPTLLGMVYGIGFTMVYHSTGDSTDSMGIAPPYPRGRHVAFRPLPVVRPAMRIHVQQWLLNKYRTAYIYTYNYIYI